MKNISIIVLCIIQSSFCMEDINKEPIIVLDINIITDETPNQEKFSGFSSVPALFKTFYPWELCKIKYAQPTILAKAVELTKTMHGATNITKLALEAAGLSFNEKRVKTLVDIGINPELKEDGIELVQRLASQKIPLILTTHHDVYHFQRYAAFLQSKHTINLKNIFSHGVVVVPDTYTSKNEESAPTYYIADEPRPSAAYARAIQFLATGRPVMLFDTDEQVVVEYSQETDFQTHHATNAADVKKVLEASGYLN